MHRFVGCYTATISPMLKNGEVDYEGLQKLVKFQEGQRVRGILAVGTTGESPTLNWEEHIKVIQTVHEDIGKEYLTIGGTGSNNTEETIRATKEVSEFGLKCVLLVDPYYNGPSSLEIRREYVAPVAEKFPQIDIIPYVIPGRSGTQLYPHDLAILQSQFMNVQAVKEATGNIENMRLTRNLCGKKFSILSGDDDKTYEMIKDPLIEASGVISVVSNIVPYAVQKLVKATISGKQDEAYNLYKSLKPLFSIVTIKTMEDTPYGPVLCRARNPLPYKTIMNVLGMPSGQCRKPLGKLTKKAFKTALDTIRKVYENTPELLEPIENYFDVSLSKNLYNERNFRGFYYD